MSADPSRAPDESRRLTRRRLRTPRAAAVAGIVFSLLLGTSMVLIQLLIPDGPPFDAEWLTKDKALVRLAATLVPFAAIGFLWFMGVIRDQLGRLEDQFFATVFLGSGILFLAGLFVWVAVIVAVLASADAAPGEWRDSQAFIFGSSMIQVMGGVVILRMAGVFMFSAATIWSRTRVMPPWMVTISYLLALALLIGGPSLRAFRFAFPLWVLAVSLLLLRVRHEARDESSVNRDT